MTPLKVSPKIRPAFLKAIEEHENFFLFRLQGDIDTHALETNREKMEEVLEEFKICSKNILCDFQLVNNSDTATLAVLISRIKELREDGHKLVFFNVPQKMLNLFEIAHLDEIFTVCSSQAEAEKALSLA